MQDPVVIYTKKLKKVLNILLFEVEMIVWLLFYEKKLGLGDFNG